MAFTQNFNSNTFGPVHWELMGPIADRPATADLHTTYVSTDEGNGVLKAYLYTESGWMQMQGIQGFTGGGSGNGGALIVNRDSNDTLDKTWQEILDADVAFVVYTDGEGNHRREFVSSLYTLDNYYYVGTVYYVNSGVTTNEYYAESPDGYPVYD